MKEESSKSTILVISMGFLFLYIVFSWQWAIIVSFVVGVVGILSSYLSRKIEWIWMKLTKLLGYIIPNILLTIVFFFILFPISLLSRLFNSDPLKLSKKYNTYFLDIRKGADKKDLKKTW
jgi:K+-transporting ATPase A subunit